MDMNAKVIPLHLHPLGFIEVFMFYGAELSCLLKGTGINENMFSRKDVKISYSQHNQLIKNGIAQCHKPGLGILVGQHMDWSYNGTVGYVVHSSPSLNAATAAFSRYLIFAQPYYQEYFNKPAFYIDSDRKVVYPLSPLGANESEPDLHLFEFEFRLALILRLCETCGDKASNKNGVQVYLNSQEPEHIDALRELPCDNVKFGCKRSYVTADFDFVMKSWRPLRRNSFCQMLHQCETEFCSVVEDTSMADKVRWLMGHMYFCEKLGLEQVANVLKMTPRALGRRLSNEGVTFRSIVHDVQMEITLHHLKLSNLSVEEIAELMGFSNASSLRRAVKNWSGCAIGEIRNWDHEEAYYSSANLHKKAS